MLLKSSGKHLVRNSLFVFFMITSCFAEDIKQVARESSLSLDNKIHLNTILGFSPFLGVFGAELQLKKHPLGIGFPNRLSYRYFLRPYNDAKFFGMYFGKMTYKNADEVVDGRQFRDLDTQYIGTGMGYRWQWLSGWNASISFAIHYYDYNFSNPGSSLHDSEKGFFPFPGGNIGYKF